MGPEGPSHAEVAGTLEVSMGVVALGRAVLEVLPEISLIGVGVNPDLSAWPYTYLLGHTLICLAIHFAIDIKLITTNFNV